MENNMENGTVEEYNDEIKTSDSFDREAEVKKIEDKIRVERQLHAGYTWFYWIAGLSLINTLAYIFGMEINFVVGLGITQIIDWVAYEIGGAVRVIGIVVNILIPGIFLLFGIMARRRKSWAFILGMIVYAADGAIFIIFREYLGIAFHVLVILGLYQGLRASMKLKSM